MKSRVTATVLVAIVTLTVFGCDNPSKQDAPSMGAPQKHDSKSNNEMNVAPTADDIKSDPAKNGMVGGGGAGGGGGDMVGSDVLINGGGGRGEIESTPIGNAKSDPVASKNYSTVKVFFGTNRKPTADPKPDNFYGRQRGTLAYGITEVSIPRDHKMGHLEQPSMWKFEWNENPERHVVLMSVTPQSEKDFTHDLKETFSNSKEQVAFVFVHGFSVSFKDAIRRTGQLAYDLGFPGVPLCFSWPSQETVTESAYLADIQTADVAAIDLARFLKLVRDELGATTIHLIAHSMGNKVLALALEKLHDEKTPNQAPFNQIVLTAPDIDAEVFERDIAPKILPLGQRVTLYASRHDWAMGVAKGFAAGYRRLGDSDPVPVVTTGIESIDVSAVDTSFVGHSYYGDNRSVISDLFALIRYSKAAKDRQLRQMSVTNGVYWLFQP